MNWYDFYDADRCEQEGLPLRQAYAVFNDAIEFLLFGRMYRHTYWQIKGAKAVVVNKGAVAYGRKSHE